MRRKGWIRVWRRIEHSAVFQDSGAFQLWVCLLLRVYHKPRRTLLKIGRQSVLVDILPGQCVLRSRLLAGDLNISRNTLDRRLKLLSDLGNIKIDTDPQHRFSLVTVLNWEKYQRRRNQHPTKAGSKSEPATKPVTGPPSEPASKPHHKKIQEEQEKREADTSAVHLQEKKPKAGLFEAPTVEQGSDYFREKEFVNLWNATDGVCKNRGDSLTTSRRNALRTRMKNPEWFQSFRESLAKFPLRCFEADSWKPDVEWILKPDSVQKILEGKYDWTKQNGNGHAKPESPWNTITGPKAKVVPR